MLKRPFQVLSSVPSVQSASPGSVAASNVYVGYPRPIEVGDHQRLVKLADPRNNVCVSGWSSYEANSDDSAALVGSSSAQPVSTSFSAQAPSSTELSARRSLDEMPHELRQLKQSVWQQQRLRRVERCLRSTFDADSILEIAVTGVADLFGAAQVSVLKHCASTQQFQQVAYYNDDKGGGRKSDDRQSSATLQSKDSTLTLSQQAFPQFWQLLNEGKSLRIFSNQLIPSSASEDLSDHAQANASQSTMDEESYQWLKSWPGNWLLVPVQAKAMQNLPAIQSLAQEASDMALTAEALEVSDEPSSVEANPNWGLLLISLPAREVWTHKAIASAQSLAVELSLAITHAQQYQALVSANQALQKLALSDGLTSLANRRRFDQHLTDEWQRLARDQQPLSLILCDLDHFKLYNDAFGHPAGDRCLIRVARALLNGPQRPADLVARYGGEEFAIILPNTDTHGAWRIAQKIHESIRALQIPHSTDGKDAFVTVTMGVSTIIPGHDNTPQMLVQASDLALYHAKQHGRNRTYVNGHYNTVEARKSSLAPGSSSDQPAVMPMEPSDEA